MVEGEILTIAHSAAVVQVAMKCNFSQVAQMRDADAMSIQTDLLGGKSNENENTITLQRQEETLVRLATQDRQPLAAVANCGVWGWLESIRGSATSLNIKNILKERGCNIIVVALAFERLSISSVLKAKRSVAEIRQPSQFILRR